MGVGGGIGCYYGRHSIYRIFQHTHTHAQMYAYTHTNYTHMSCTSHNTKHTPCTHAHSHTHTQHKNTHSPNTIKLASPRVVPRLLVTSQPYAPVSPVDKSFTVSIMPSSTYLLPSPVVAVRGEPEGSVHWNEITDGTAKVMQLKLTELPLAALVWEG